MGVKRDQESAGMSNDTLVITEAEAALYDRQIRLWGLDCQKRIRDAKILIIGLNGLGIEVVKNLALSGVKSITIMDETPVTELDYSAQFYAVGSAGTGLSRSSASKEAIQELNPNVEIIIDSDQLSSKNPNFFARFSAVFATDCPLSLLIRVNKACHEHGTLFYCGDCWGFYGYGFLDLLKHTYTRKAINAREEKQETPILVNIEYCALGPALSVKVGAGLNKKVNKVYILLNILDNFRETHNRVPMAANREEELTLLKSARSFISQKLGCEESKVGDEVLSNVFGELSPVCAAVGGVMANEIVKGVSKKGEPLHNFFLFNGEECNGVVETIIVKD